MTETIERLLDKPYWIIDILPEQVPKDSPGQYFAVERWFRKEQMAAIRQKHINTVLKLNCYYDLTFVRENEEKSLNPEPARIAEIMKERYVYILVGDAMILSEPDDIYMTLFNADDELVEKVRRIAGSEGLFVWKGVG